MPYNPLPKSFYLETDVVAIAKALLGKKIVTHIGGRRVSGMIVETESYDGNCDRASHAYPNKRTARTQTMFCEGGIIYMYLCYGIHHMLNIVTGPKDAPQAVLIRAIEPLEGVEIMMARRGLSKVQRNLTAGPGLVGQALGLTLKDNGQSLLGPKIWIEPYQSIKDRQILIGPRVGVAYAGDCQHRPWRFQIKSNPWLSPAK